MQPRMDMMTYKARREPITIKMNLKALSPVRHSKIPSHGLGGGTDGAADWMVEVVVGMVEMVVEVAEVMLEMVLLAKVPVAFWMVFMMGVREVLRDLTMGREREELIVLEMCVLVEYVKYVFV